MMSDDEFFFPSGLIHLLSYDSGLTHSSISGDSYYYSRSLRPPFRYFNRLRLPVNLFRPRLRLFPSYLYSRYQPFELSCLASTLHHFGPFYSPRYINSLLTTSAWTLAINLSLSFEYPIFGLNELLFEASCALTCTSTYQPSPYWLRSIDVPPQFSSDDRSPHNPANLLSSTPLSLLTQIAKLFSLKLLRMHQSPFSYEEIYETVLLALRMRSYYESCPTTASNLLKYTRNKHLSSFTGLRWLPGLHPSFSSDPCLLKEFQLIGQSFY